MWVKISQAVDIVKASIPLLKDDEIHAWYNVLLVDWPILSQNSFPSGG